MNSSLTSKIQDFFNKLKSGKKIQYLIVILLAIILVGIICFNFSSYSANSSNENLDVNDYVSSLESKLSKTLSKVNGAGNVSVVITVESGLETVYAYQTKTTETINGVVTENLPITVNGKPVVLKELNPKIIGVLIVAEGGSNIAVITKLQQATVSLLNIEPKQIEILSM